MASDRVFIIHTVAQVGVMLGKHMNAGWYRPPEKDLMYEFYDYINEYDPTDLYLFIETQDTTWAYGGVLPNGLREFIRLKPEGTLENADGFKLPKNKSK